MFSRRSQRPNVVLIHEDRHVTVVKSRILGAKKKNDQSKRTGSGNDTNRCGVVANRKTLSSEQDSGARLGVLKLLATGEPTIMAEQTGAITRWNDEKKAYGAQVNLVTAG